MYVCMYVSRYLPITDIITIALADLALITHHLLTFFITTHPTILAYTCIYTSYRPTIPDP